MVGPTTAPGNVGGLYSAGNPFAGIPATVIDAPTLSAMLREQLAIVEAGGLSPSNAQRNQVLTALEILFGGGSAELSAAASASLGLGDAFAFGLDRHSLTVLSRQSGLWIAGESTGQPTQGTGSGGSGPGASDNTVQANEVDTGVHAGEAWPYQVCTAQMESSTSGTYPAVLFGSGRNGYSDGFTLPGGTFVNGAVLEVILAGIYHSTEGSRTLEFVIEPDFDPSVAYASAKAFPAQTSQVPDTLGTEHAWEARFRLIALGYDSGSDEWVVGAQFSFRLGDAPDGVEGIDPAFTRRSYVKRIANATVDFRADHRMGVRFKTEDAGATIGDTGPTSSAQDGSASVVETRLFQAHLYQGGH